MPNLNRIDRMEYLREALRAENISYEELHELQSLKVYIKEWDTELLEAAGVPEGSEIPVEDLVYTSEPSVILVRNNTSICRLGVMKMRRYKSTQGAHMIQYDTYCNTINKRYNTFYVSYGLKGDYTNITIHPHFGPFKK